MKYILGLALCFLALLAACPAQTGPMASSAIANNARKTYYLSPSGDDSHTGLSGAPWLTPNHALNCGDVIIASSATTYSASNFGSGKWGTVTCPSGSGVAWLTCATFDGCKISAGSTFGMYVDKNYWGVSGWEVTTSSSGWSCFAVAPPSSGAAASIHHIIFANDVANGCGGGGFNAFNVGAYGFDYVAFVGDIAYNTAQGSLHCYSGMSLYQPVASDSAAGTHIYVGGNFSYANFDPTSCESGADNGGDGLILDTFDRAVSQSGGTGIIYTQQVVQAYNMLIGNGATGYEYQTYTDSHPAPAHPTVYRYNNTAWGNNADPNRNGNFCAQTNINIGFGITDTANIAETSTALNCTGHTESAMSIYQGDGVTDSVSGNWFYAVAGTTPTATTFNSDGNSFTYGTNHIGTSAAFTAPSVPGAPSCTGTVNTVDCMSAMIGNFVPTASGTAGLGYASPSLLTGTDTLFPKWLCTANLPIGLVTMKC